MNTITLGFPDIYKGINNFIKGNTIDLSQVEFVYPYFMVMVYLLLTERGERSDRRLILPKDSEKLTFLKRIHFDKILSEIGYPKEAKVLTQFHV